METVAFQFIFLSWSNRLLFVYRVLEKLGISSYSVGTTEGYLLMNNIVIKVEDFLKANYSLFINYVITVCDYNLLITVLIIAFLLVSQPVSCLYIYFYKFFVCCVSLLSIIFSLTNPTIGGGYKVPSIGTCCRRKPADPELVWRPNDLY